jgi:thiamine biosynthesis lipoprotein ApbE
MNTRLGPALRFSAVALAMIASAIPRSQAQTPQAPQVFRFHHDNILGTSLDLEVSAGDEQQAGAVDTAVLDEIERLRKILSTYDPTSDISRLNATNTPVVCPPELIQLLSYYDFWTAKSKGAYNGHLGELIATWKAAEKGGVLPDAATLQPIVQRLAQPGWLINPGARTVTRLTTQPLNVDSLGKGYIISKAVAAAKAKLPAIPGILLNIGGDIFASGHPSPGAAWTISVANPAQSEDNAPPLLQLRLVDRAVSTSAAYERGYNIGGKHYSHIFDPRTGWPANGVASATVIAPYSANSNALATTLCVLKPAEGLELARQIPDVECLIIGADGLQYRSAHFAAYEVPQAQPQASATPTTAAAQQPAKGSLWPNGYQVTLAISLKPPTEPNLRHLKRPFMAVWVTDANGNAVRTIAVWGNQRKYLPELHEWWKVAKDAPEWAATVTRATRSAGHYRLEWDGLDDHGAPLAPGTYTITQEVNREFGAYVIEKGTIVCGNAPAKGTIAGSSEFDQTDINYGPPPPPSTP